MLSKWLPRQHVQRDSTAIDGILYPLPITLCRGLTIIIHKIKQYFLAKKSKRIFSSFS